MITSSYVPIITVFPNKFLYNKSKFFLINDININNSNNIDGSNNIDASYDIDREFDT